MRHQLHIFPGFGIGGAQRRFAQLYDALPDWRHTVVSLSGDRSAIALCREGEGRLAFAPFDWRPTRGLSPGAIRRLARLIRETKPDLLCTYNWGSIEAVIANRIGPRRPHLHFEDGFGPDEADRRSPVRDTVRRMALRPIHLAVPSRTLETIARKEWRVPGPRCHFVPNGIDTDRFTPPSEPRPDTARQTVLSVAALRPEKDLGALVTACQTVGLPLRIVGEGPERARLETHAISEGAQVRFVGAMDDPSPAYRTADIFALSSRTEQAPITVLEAMAAGLPVAATDVGDIAGMVSEENRPFVVPRDDPEAYATALRQLADDPGRSRLIGAANRARAVAEFSETAMITRYADLFDRVAAG